MTEHDASASIDLTLDQGQASQRLAQHYAALLGKFGHSARALDWGSAQSQERRFAVLAGIADLSGASILDVGCGLADLHAWLAVAGIPHRYSGIDLTPEMAAQAAKRFPGARIINADFARYGEFAPRSFDYVFASGVFAFCRHDPEQYLHAMVAKMFCLCRRGVAFNALSAWRADKEPDEFYPDPLAVAARCAALTPCLALRHDYHPGDFTLYLYRTAGEAGDRPEE